MILLWFALIQKYKMFIYTQTSIDFDTLDHQTESYWAYYWSFSIEHTYLRIQLNNATTFSINGWFCQLTSHNGKLEWWTHYLVMSSYKEMEKWFHFFCCSNFCTKSIAHISLCVGNGTVNFKTTNIQLEPEIRRIYAFNLIL